MACAVVSAAFRLPFATRRLSKLAAIIRSHHSTVCVGHLRRITTASSMSQKTDEIDSVVDASLTDENSAANPDDVEVLRRDLIDSWPLGSVVTQGCHASVAAIWLFKDDPVTLQYCDQQHIDSMHKVTLEVKGDEEFIREIEVRRNLSQAMDGTTGEYSDVYRHKALPQISSLFFL